ncbi:MAG: NAD(P)H-quinone oxidoreductase [Acidobacteriales bacterium]|nr:NAD(P)H-quinone oxidoreductase [Terriglobales bacterium]
MRAAVITVPGGPEVLEIHEVPAPVAGEREILVKVFASAINRADLLQRMGKYPAPPGAPRDIPGLEFAGEVAALGPGATQWRPGQRVFGITGGGAHAEFLTIHEDAAEEIPGNLSWSEAGAVPEAFITAHDALLQANLRAGDHVLIHAVCSGVGLAAMQLVRAFGSVPFGTSRTQGKLDRAKSGDLEDCFCVPDPSSLASMPEWAREVTNDRGFDIVLDLNGGPYFPASLRAMALKGRIVLIGATAGATAEVDLRHIFSRRLHIIGTVLRARPLEEKIEVTRRFADQVVPKLADGTLRPVIDSEFSLQQIQDAHRRVMSDQTFGKVVLRIAR